MQAITTKPLNLDDPNAFALVELPDPKPGPNDVLVRVHAVSVNPIDNKMRMVPTRDGSDRILGWDASGIVQAVGSAVSRFHGGERVFYAGSVQRSGTNAQLHCVDERLVGRMPSSLSFSDAASLPLTALTAWESLFEHLDLGVRRFEMDQHDNASTLLVIGGAGGVGSVAIQLARQVAGTTVVASASRAESRQWCLDMGANHIVDHHADIAEQFKSLGISAPDTVLFNTQPDRYYEPLAKLLAPFGRMCSIVDAASSLDLMKLRNKAAEFSWQGMFTRSNFQTRDMIQQARILDKVSQWVDEGRIVSTRQADFGSMSAQHLRDAHVAISSGSMIGKGVLTWIAD